MGSATMLLSALAVALLVVSLDAAGTDNCPQPSKVYSCSPKCVQNYDCTHGKVCCTNSCNAKSCVEPSALGGAGGSGKDKYSQSSGAGVYCNNIKCNSFEVCKQDPATKRMKCQRA